MTVTESPTARQQATAFWYLLGAAGVVLVFVYFPILRFLVENWINDEDMGHGFFVPLVAGYLAWQQREVLLAQSYQPNRWGLLIVLYGAVQMIVAHLGVELFLSRTAFIVSLVGCIFYMGGWPLLKRLAFPISLLAFMIPLPAIVYNQITFPLQLFASQVAEAALSALGIAVLREGNVLELPSGPLAVVEACSGIRSLLALTFMSLTYAALFDPRPWMKMALFTATIPIAIFSNSLRVTITGLLSEWNPELAKGVFHSMEGIVMYGFSLLLLFGAHRALTTLAKHR